MPDFTELEDLELGATEDEKSSAGSGAGAELPDSSPHAMKIHAKTSANTNRPKMDCFALTGLAMTFVKIFTEPPVTSIVFDKFS